MWPRLGVLLRAAVRVKRGGPRRDGLVLMDGVGIRESCRFRCLFGVVTLYPIETVREDRLHLFAYPRVPCVVLTQIRDPMNPP